MTATLMSCPLAAKMLSYDRDFQRILETYSMYHKEDYIEPTVCIITTHIRLNIDMIDLRFIIEDSDLVVRTNRRRSKKSIRQRHFFNSVTLEFGKKTIKAFQNGSLHVTGCTSLTHCLDMVRQFVSAMPWDVDKIFITDFKIQTYNLKMGFKKVVDDGGKLTPSYIDLTKMNDVLQRKDGMMCRYTPDVYHGLVLKTVCEDTKKQLSFLCFYTGIFIITAVTNPTELAYGLRFIMSLLKEIHKNIV